jgi:hypothetical protein
MWWWQVHAKHSYFVHRECSLQTTFKLSFNLPLISFHTLLTTLRPKSLTGIGILQSRRFQSRVHKAFTSKIYLNGEDLDRRRNSNKKVLGLRRTAAQQFLFKDWFQPLHSLKNWLSVESDEVWLSKHPYTKPESLPISSGSRILE